MRWTKRGRAAAALPGVRIPKLLPLGREVLSPQEDTRPCPAHHGDGRAPAGLRTARSQQVGVQPLSAAWRRPVALLVFSVGKLRHGAVAVAEPAALKPSCALSLGPCCLSLPGGVSFLL